MNTFFRGITESIPSLFRGIFSERNSVANPNVAWQVGTINRVVTLARQAGNRFLGSLKGLHTSIRALDARQQMRALK